MYNFVNNECGHRQTLIEVTRYASIPRQHYQSGVLKLAIQIQSTWCTKMDSW